MTLLADKKVVKIIAQIVLIISSQCFHQSVDGAKILFIPGNMNSHILLNMRLGESLAKLNHQVHIIVPHNSHVKTTSTEANFTVSTYTVGGDTPFVNSATLSKSIIETTLEGSSVRGFLKMIEVTKILHSELESDCQHLLGNATLMESIRSSNYDFAVMDPLAINCYFVIPYSLGIPYATMSIPWCRWLYRVPALPSFASNLGYSDVMTFKERLHTFVLELAQIFMLPENSSYTETYAPDKPVLSLLGLVEKSSLYFYVEDIALGYARPHMPNTVSVGDIISNQPVLPLSTDFEEFVQGSSPGSVIVVSFGSYLDHVPRDVAHKFCEAFRGLKEHRIIWKLKYPEYCPETLAPNVKIVPWLPQNDLLADERVHLFINHGGFNSLIEAVFHAKPVIVFPLAIDQPTNAAIVQSKGMGIWMDLRTFTVDELQNNIQRILTSPPNNYTDAVHRASALLKDKPDGGAAQRISNLINHVIKYGDSHLRTGAFQLSLLQFFMIDIFMFLTIAVLSFLSLFGLCSYCACKVIINKCCRASRKISDKRRKMK